MKLPHTRAAVFVGGVGVGETGLRLGTLYPAWRDVCAAADVDAGLKLGYSIKALKTEIS
jgi:hypothetical protein